MKLTMMGLAIAATMMVSCSTAYNSTTDNAAYNVDVPMGIRSGFAASYPDASGIVWNSYDINTVPIDWELAGWNALDANDYAVTYSMGGDKYYSWYDADGTLVGTAYAISDYSKLPNAVNTALRDKYSGYTIETAGKEMWGNKVAYEVKLKNGDSKMKVLVDADGNVLKEKMK